MLCSWNYLTVNVALWHVNSKELVDFQLTHLVQNLLESSELPVTIASIRLAAGAGTRCPVMIAHRADSDWEISHHDHRMSSLKCLRTPGWRKQKQICLLFLVEGIRNRFVCYLAFICSESKKLIWVIFFPSHLLLSFSLSLHPPSNFSSPAMQEDALKLVLLALEDGSALSRKVLVLFVVQKLEARFPQASKTSIGHVVQLLYRASCFKVQLAWTMDTH